MATSRPLHAAVRAPARTAVRAVARAGARRLPMRAGVVDSSAMTGTPASAAAPVRPDVARLVQRARLGDARAFAELHADFARSVHAVLLARLPAADVDDALQEAFVIAWKRLGSLRDAGAIGPWLH